MLPLPSKPDIWMQITIPPEYQAVGKYNIGCTAGIESTGCEASWVEGMNRMDINLVSSNHSKTVFSSVKFDKRDKNTNQSLGIVQTFGCPGSGTHFGCVVSTCVPEGFVFTTL